MTRILLVGDHEGTWDFLSRRLKPQGYEVVAATNEQQGLNKVRSEHSGVSLLDIDMPVMDGWTRASEVKKDPGTASMQTAALAACAMSGSRMEALRRHQAIEALVAARRHP